MLMAIECLFQTAWANYTLTDEETDSKLTALEPLPKVHYSSAIPKERIAQPYDRKAYEFCRIAHSLTVHGEYLTLTDVENCVYICERVNRLKPKIKSSIAVQLSPFHNKFGKDLPPTDRGPTYRAELDFIKLQLQKLNDYVQQGNSKYAGDVNVSAVLLDTEVFHTREADNRWNDAIREALDDVHTLVLSIFPDVSILWYGRGVGMIWGGDGWGKSDYFTGKEIKSSLSCSLYTPPEILRVREEFRRTVELAETLDINAVIPWVSLASGYRPGLKKAQRFVMDWDYDLIYSYQLGAEINIPWYAERPKRYAPYDHARVVVFYPPAFDPRVKHWAKHFIAYVRGATGVSKLDDLGFDD